MRNSNFTQESLGELLLPVLRSEGIVYKKYKPVFAKKCLGGEQVVSITSDGLETFNEAAEGDYLVENQTVAREMYIVPKEKFLKRYEWAGPGENGFEQYSPSGEVVAVEMTEAFLGRFDLPQNFHFLAPWGEPMVAKEGDFLVTPPDFSEIYRIARKEFFETYAAKIVEHQI